MLLAVPMTGAGSPALFVANSTMVRRVDGKGAVLQYPGAPGSPVSHHGILAVDWNSDYRIDLVFAGAGGLKLFEQKEDGNFTEVTAATKLDPAVVRHGCVRRLGGRHRIGRRPRPGSGREVGQGFGTP